MRCLPDLPFLSKKSVFGGITQFEGPFPPKNPRDLPSKISEECKAWIRRKGAAQRHLFLYNAISLGKGGLAAEETRDEQPPCPSWVSRAVLFFSGKGLFPRFL